MSLYAQRDHYKLSPQFEHHMLAMTGEGLYGKAAIAAELAVRDIVIEKLMNASCDGNLKGWVRLQLASSLHNTDPPDDRHSSGMGNNGEGIQI